MSESNNTLGDVRVNITGSLAGLSRAFTQARSMSKGFADSVGGAMTKGIGGAISGITGILVGGVAKAASAVKNIMTGIVEGIVNIVTSAFKAALIGLGALTAALGYALYQFGDNESAAIRLSNAIELAGGNAGELSEKYGELARNIQKVSRVSSAEATNMMAYAAGLGANADQLGEVVKISVGLAEKTGLTLERVVRNVASVMQGGSAGILERYIPALKAAQTAQEKLGVLNTLGIEGLELTGRNMAALTSKLTRLKNIFNDTAAAIGKSVSAKMGFGKLIDAIAAIISNFEEAFDKFASGLEGSFGFVDKVIDKLDQAGKSLFTTGVFLTKVFSEIKSFDDFKTVIGAVMTTAATTFISIIREGFKALGPTMVGLGNLILSGIKKALLDIPIVGENIKRTALQSQYGYQSQWQKERYEQYRGEGYSPLEATKKAANAAEEEIARILDSHASKAQVIAILDEQARKNLESGSKTQQEAWSNFRAFATGAGKSFKDILEAKLKLKGIDIDFSKLWAEAKGDTGKFWQSLSDLVRPDLGKGGGVAPQIQGALSSISVGRSGVADWWGKMQESVMAKQASTEEKNEQNTKDTAKNTANIGEQIKKSNQHLYDIYNELRVGGGAGSGVFAT